MIDISGVKVNAIEIVSQISGGDYNADGQFNLYHNEVDVHIESRLSDVLFSVTHVQDGNSLWEIKELGPFVFFAVFNIRELIDPSLNKWGAGAFGSKYLGVNCGGWSSRAECFNELGYTDPVMEVNIIQEGSTSRSIAHMPVHLVDSLLRLHDIEVTAEQLVEHAVYSKVCLGEPVDKHVCFANHSGL